MMDLFAEKSIAPMLMSLIFKVCAAQSVMYHKIVVYLLEQLLKT